MWLYCRVLCLERIISFLLCTIEGMWCYCFAYGSLVCIWLKIHQGAMGACILNLISVLDVQYLRYVPATYQVNARVKFSPSRPWPTLNGNWPWIMNFSVKLCGHFWPWIEFCKLINIFVYITEQ